MTMQMELHPQYVTNEDGEKVSVILPIEEFQELVEQYQNKDLSHLGNEIDKGFESKVLDQTHKEVFKELRQKYV